MNYYLCMNKKLSWKVSLGISAGILLFDFLVLIIWGAVEALYLLAGVINPLFFLAGWGDKAPGGVLFTMGLLTLLVVFLLPLGIIDLLRSRKKLQ